MSEQDGTKAATQQRPTNGDKEGWNNYWKAHGQPWRLEPEIDDERKKYLAERLSIIPDIEQGMYPFKDIKLNRAEVEWLLATHENGRGPVDWTDESQRNRTGLDLRGADLSKVDLHDLPLVRSRCGLAWSLETPEQLDMAGTHLEGANLCGAHLEGANFRGSYFGKSDLSRAHMEEVELSRAHMEEAILRDVNMEKAILVRTHLEGALLSRAHLEGTNLHGTHFERALLYKAHLEGAHLRSTFFDTATNLENIILGNEKVGFVSLVDIHWGDVNLSVVNWPTVKTLGDEHLAREGKELYKYQDAVRANRQLSVVLQAQGLNEDAARFAYRAQVLQKKVLRLQLIQPGMRLRHRGRVLAAMLLSWFLFLLAGYGYRPGRSFLAYLIVITGFATAYYFLGHREGLSLSQLGAFVFSMTSFHGRGFFPGNNIRLDDPLTVLAALEAFVGLLIEVTFIATLTQRLFGK